MRSPISYVGSKHRMLPLLLDRIPRVEHCVDVFCGGLSVGLNVAARGARVSAYDIDPALVGYWNHQIRSPSALYDAVEALLPMNCAKYFALREQLLSAEDDLARAAAFFAVQRWSFASLGAAGGPAPNRGRLHRSTMRLILETNLDRVTVEQLDYRHSIHRHPDSFLFLDPPYVMDLANGDCLYGPDGGNHRAFDHSALFDLLKDRTGWLMTYGDHPTVREIYADFPIERHIATHSAFHHRERPELLIYPRPRRSIFAQAYGNCRHE